MQNAKDTFYAVLRDRLAGLNPERTVVVRGVTRPGLVVVENELGSASPAGDCFALTWTKAGVDSHGALPTVTMTCEIHYGTAGSAEIGGLDRGRMLAGMDAELAAAVAQEPRHAVKKSFAASGMAGAPSTEMNTRIWWGEVEFSEAKAMGGADAADGKARGVELAGSR